MIPCDLSALSAELAADEGRRRRRYLCPAAKWTIGIGHNLDGKRFRADTWAAIKAEHPHLTNALLDDQVELSDALIDRIFADDVEDAVDDLDSIWTPWRGLSEARKRALINLSFQLGRDRLAAFPRFWAGLRRHDYEAAAAELVESLWYRQTQASRTSRVVRQIREG